MNQELVSAIKDIISDKGIDFLSDNAKMTVCMLRDLVPTADKERRRIKIALESQAFEELLKIGGKPDSAETLFQRAVVFLIDETDWSEDIADDTLSTLFAALYPDIQRNSNGNTSSVASKPAKKKVVKATGQGYEYFDDDYSRTWLLEFTKEADGYVISKYSSFGDEELIELPSVYKGEPVVGIAVRVFANTGIDKVIAPSIVRIGDSAFEGSCIKEIMFSNSLHSIGKSAFSCCHQLSTITLPDSVEEIMDSAFSHAGLKNVVLPKNIKNLNDRLFEGCHDMCQITLSEGLTEIGASVFAGCISLRSLVIPDSVNSIHDEAFEGSYIKSMMLSKNISRINIDSINQCTEIAIRGLQTEIVYNPVRVCDLEVQTYVFTHKKSGIQAKSNYVVYKGKQIWLDQVDHSLLLNPLNISIYCIIGSPAFNFAKEHGITCRHISEYKG